MPAPPDKGLSEALISVIVPIHAVEDYVGACISSLRHQTYQNFEVLMVDDGSPDDSAACALEAAGDDPRFRLISQPNNGLSAARNTGLAQARGSFLAFVDSDDRVTADFLARLHGALEDHPEAPWAACAIRNRYPDGGSMIHSAIHDAPDPVLAPGTQVFHFKSATDVIRHYPSVWNKLYRRAFFGDLRFPEGTWFEDHSVYLRLALQAPCLVHLADPLYEQTRGRPGQITETDSDRVFEQLAVLDDVLPVLEAGPLSDGKQAAHVLACRLLSERSTALRSPERRAAFASRARTALETRGITYKPDPAQGISAVWKMELDGELPLSVIVPWDGRAEAPLVATLTAFKNQHGPGFELVIVCDTQRAIDRATALAGARATVLRNVGQDPGTATDTGLKAAKGRFVMVFDAGDLPDPWAFHNRVEAMLATDAEICVSARAYGPDSTEHAGFEKRHVPAHNHGPAPFHPTPPQALSADLAISAAVFDRNFLEMHGLSPASCGRHSAWPLLLGAYLLAERAVYLPHADVNINPDAAARGLLSRSYPLHRLARDHQRLCAAMPAVALYALPRGWERRLMARALRLWLVEGPKRGWLPQKLAEAGAAGLIALRGMGKSGQYWPAGFDAQVGPKFGRLFDTAGLLRLVWPRERARLAAGGALPGEARAVPLEVRNLYSPHPAHAFPLTEQGLVRLRVGFETQTFANINFYAGDGHGVPLHFCLRQNTGQIVLNDTRTDGLWRAERRRAYDLPRRGLEAWIEIAPARRGSAVRLWLDGQLVWELGLRSLRNRGGLSGLEQITHLELDGDITPLDLRPDPIDPAQGLVLDGRLRLRKAGAPRPDANLGCSALEEPLQMLAMDLSPGQPGSRTTLPARVWSNIPQNEALVVEDGGAGTSGKNFSLTRRQLAKRIATLLRQGLPMGDADLILEVIEHVALAGLTPMLDTGAQTELARLTQRFGLTDYLPDLLHTIPNTANPLAPFMADLVARARRGSAGNPDALLAEMPRGGVTARHLARLLVETATLEDRMEALFDEARAADLLPMPLEATDTWTLSASLPYLWLEGREAEMLETLRDITRPGPGWRVTPALAWIGRRAVDGDPAISPAGREAALKIILTWLRRESRDYWGCSASQALTDWAAEVAATLHRLPRSLQSRTENAFIYAYGLSRSFWQALARQDVGDAPSLTPRLALAKAAFDKVNHAPDMHEKAEALERLHRLGAGDIVRARIEYLGPAGVALPQDASLTPEDLLPVAGPRRGAMDLNAVRHMAYPGTAPASPETADMVHEALRGLVQEQDPSPFAGLQRLVYSKCAALLAAPHEAEKSLPSLLDDLARLNREATQYLGPGLAIALLGVLTAPAAQRRIADWLNEQDACDPNDPRQDVAYWRRRAPAVRMSLARLANIESPDVARVLARFTSLPQGITDADAAARSLPALPQPGPGDGLPPPHPLNDVIVTVFSCHPYLDTRIPALRKGWLADLEAMGIPYVIVVGNGDGTLRGDVLHVDAPDGYEGLPQKTLATIDWVRRHCAHSHMFKIDDDCYVDPQALFGSLDYRKCDYMGRKLYRAPGQMDRTWHQAKSTSERGRLELDKSPEPSTYADGGSGYVLSRDAMEAACAAAQSPAGRALLQASFMEDKLLGDLLILRNIHLSTPGYITSIRRRTFGDATPVAFWNLGFYPSRAAPTQQVHLDTHEGQQELRALRDAPELRPRKIWPSYEPPKLGYQSNGLELLSSERSVELARTAPVSVVAVMRNEIFMARHFLAHYRALGVTSFLIADNASDDGTREFLLEQEDVALFSVDTDYRKSHYGVAWQQALLSAFRVGKWSLVADADELLVWQATQTQTLPELLASSLFEEADAARIFMLDMYPDGPLEEATFNGVSPFAQARLADRVPFVENPLTRGPFSDQTLWTSALRHRLIPGTRPDLFAAQKIALLKYRPWMRLSAGLHFVTPPRRADCDLFFGHFKYNADFRRKAQAEVARKQHFNDAEEYRKYLALTSEGRAKIYDPDLSLPWEDVPFVRARLLG